MLMAMGSITDVRIYVKVIVFSRRLTVVSVEQVRHHQSIMVYLGSSNSESGERI